MIETLSNQPWYFQSLFALVLGWILSDFGIFILKQILPLINEELYELFNERKNRMIGKYIITGTIFIIVMWGLSRL